MTYTEIIAVKLFGWESMNCEWPDEIWYCHPSGAEHRLGTPYNEYIVVDGEEEWPDFEDERLKWYWIRRMEDSLAERGLNRHYMVALWHLYAGHRNDPFPDLDNPECCLECGLRATAEQRVEAAVKVLEGQG